MLISYGVDNKEVDPYASYYARLNVERIKAQDNTFTYRKHMLIAEKERLEKELCGVNEELKRLEKEASNKALSSLERKGLSKKEIIIELYNYGITSEKIQEYAKTDKSYVQKVLSLYRKEKGIQNQSKGLRTKQMIMACLNSGKSAEETALHLDLSVQYVYKVKKEYENIK